MCHRFTMLVPDEVDRVIAHLRLVARLMDAGVLGGGRDEACALPPLRRPLDFQDIDAFPGSECQVIVMGTAATGAAREVGGASPAKHPAGRDDAGAQGEEVSHVRMFHVKHSDEDEAARGALSDKGAAGDGEGGRAGGPREAIAERLESTTLTWGIDVPWKTGLVFNTRIESALGGSALWREALAEGRCLVPVRAFFETRNVEPSSEALPLGDAGSAAGAASVAGADDAAAGGCDEGAGSPGRVARGRRPQFRFAGPGNEALLLAGLRQGDRFTVVTTEPNDAVAPIHNRMPLVLSPAEALVWLSGGPDELAALADRARIALEFAEQPPATRAKTPDPNQLSLF